MKVNTFVQGGYSSGGFTSAGGTLTGPLVLVGNPTLPMEAAPKQYVDAAVSALSAGNLTSGTIPVGRLPAMAGDATSSVNSNVLTLSASGVTAGTYPKVVVDTKGRVTGGAALAAGDIPSLDWSKIGSGKPTTLGGYGISDGMNVGGGTMTGFLTLSGAPTAALHAATKGYVDSALSASTGLSVGDVIRKPYSTTPSGFLKCNGAYVSQTSYSGLFSAIGHNFDPYSAGGASYINFSAIGSGQPWKQQYDTNLTQSGDITGWVTGTSLPVALTDSQAIVTKNRVYLLGGHITGAYSAVVYTAPINVDGTLGGWTTSASLPATVGDSQAIVTKNRVYLLGGWINSVESAVVYTAPINVDGTLGSWTTSASLPGVVTDSQAIVTKNRVYLLGGGNGFGASRNTYTAPINVDGTLGVWSAGTSLPGALIQLEAIVTKNRVYTLGGNSTAGGLSPVYTAPINVDGTLGSWTTSGSLPATVYSTKAIVTKNKVYLLGGFTNGVASAAVYTAPINLDGTLGNWTTSTSLPGTVYNSQAITTKNRVYILGGNINGASSAVVYTTGINGGANDYSAYYDGSVNLFDGSNPTDNPSPTTMFGLPDASTLDASTNLYHYIKS